MFAPQLTQISGVGTAIAGQLLITVGDNPERILDQSPQLEDIDLDTARAPAPMYGKPPPLGPYRTYQVPIMDIIDLTGLNLTALSEADVYAPGPAIREDTDHRTRWVELVDTAGIHL